MDRSAQKIYCYVDENGQDAGSGCFIVVPVIIAGNLDSLRLRIEEIESKTQVGSIKWHKLRPKDRLKFLTSNMEARDTVFKIYFEKHNKNIPFFLSISQTIRLAILDFKSGTYFATIYEIGKIKTNVKQTP